MKSFNKAIIPIVECPAVSRIRVELTFLNIALHIVGNVEKVSEFCTVVRVSDVEVILQVVPMFGKPLSDEISKSAILFDLRFAVFGVIVQILNDQVTAIIIEIQRVKVDIPRTFFFRVKSDAGDR